MTDKTEAQEAMNELRTMRDELELKLHLMGMEARDKWEDLEAKWENLRNELKPTENEVDQAVDNISSATDILLDEIRVGYGNIKRTLK